jgi:iron complex outermembrane receptor protein
VFTPTVGAQWHFNRRHDALLSFSKGFKAGGWTHASFEPLADIDRCGLRSEKSETYELGSNPSSSDHRVQANIAVFWTDYTGIQLQIQEGASPVSQNAGDAELKGAELELHALLGGARSRCTWAASYIDAKYTELQDLGAGHHARYGSAEDAEYKYTHQPAVGREPVRTTASCASPWIHQDRFMFNDAPNTPLLARPSTDNLGASVHYFSAEEKYSVTLGGTNLTDDRYPHRRLGERRGRRNRGYLQSARVSGT